MTERAHQYGGFPCPECGAMANMKRSHIHFDTKSRWRRHYCPKGHRFSTVQVIVQAPRGLWNRFRLPENTRQNTVPA